MTESGGLDPGLLARFLRQRMELGAGELVLETLDRVQAARMVAGAGSWKAPVAGEDPGRVAAAEAPGRGGGPGPTPGDAAPSAAPSGRPPESGVADELPVLELPPGYDEVRAAALACTRCGLASGRTQVVFSDGNPRGRLMVVGEAPGANEDRTGLPFVGQAGRLLDLMLASVDLSRRDSVYICNVIKCRPPGNRNPTPPEIEACSPYLRRQIELVAPRAILGVGSFAAHFLTGRQIALGKLRGEVYSYQGVPVVVTYHPAALLRNPGWTQAAWTDLQLLREVLDRLGE